MDRKDKVWQTAAVAKAFLSGVRTAIPLAAEQLDVMLRVIQVARPQVEHFLDLGCGDGVLGRAILEKYPQAEGVLLDFSEPMLQAARDKSEPYLDQLEFVIEDFGKPEWVDLVQAKGFFDVVVSGFAIHHQPDQRKKEIYQEIYRLLQPGGVFLNLEHVSSSSQLGEKVHDALVIDYLYDFHQRHGGQSRDEIAQTYDHRADKAANILAPVEAQCDWLRKSGFIHVDCFMKVFELALFGGVRP
ncbi:MAG TPA: class I SAM-dependent methyltransferase [Candidatus Caenarcaniphilales bacterium]